MTAFGTARSRQENARPGVMPTLGPPSASLEGGKVVIGPNLVHPSALDLHGRRHARHRGRLHLDGDGAPGGGAHSPAPPAAAAARAGATFGWSADRFPARLSERGGNEAPAPRRRARRMEARLSAGRPGSWIASAASAPLRSQRPDDLSYGNQPRDSNDALVSHFAGAPGRGRPRPPYFVVASKAENTLSSTALGPPKT